VPGFGKFIEKSSDLFWVTHEFQYRAEFRRAEQQYEIRFRSSVSAASAANRTSQGTNETGDKNESTYFATQYKQRTTPIAEEVNDMHTTPIAEKIFKCSQRTEESSQASTKEQKQQQEEQHSNTIK